jgi:hypothetical protein
MNSYLIILNFIAVEDKKQEEPQFEMDIWICFKYKCK